MEPLAGIFDEKFFSEGYASDDCLRALAALMDDKLAVRFKTYIDSPEANELIKHRMELFLGDAIKACLFPLTLDSEGYDKAIQGLDLLTLADSLPEEQGDLLEKLRFLNQNDKYIRTTTNVRTKTMYDKFYRSLPRGMMRGSNGGMYPYASLVAANKDVFYKQGEPARRSASASAYRRRNGTCTICLLGLEYRAYCKQKGIPLSSSKVVAF